MFREKMGYSVVLIHGGEYSNIQAPLMMEAATLGALEHSVIDNFELKNDTKLTLTYCGEILRHSQKMPRDGATIFASVAHALQGDTIPTQPPTQSMNQFDEAFRFLNRHTDHRQRSPIREKVRQIIELQLEKRYASHPALCHADIEGARICSSYDMFVAAALTDKKLAEKHKLLQRLVVGVFKEAKTKLPAMLPPGIGGPIVPFGGGASSNQPSSQTRSANPARTQSNALITPQMLSQALSAAAGGGAARGQTATPSTSANAQVAALSQAVENGIQQLREMGILAQTNEANARRILAETGGNVEAAINRILES
jgi:hypothetical protein